MLQKCCKTEIAVHKNGFSSSIIYNGKHWRRKLIEWQLMSSIRCRSSQFFYAQLRWCRTRINSTQVHFKWFSLYVLLKSSQLLCHTFVTFRDLKQLIEVKEWLWKLSNLIHNARIVLIVESSALIPEQKCSLAQRIWALCDNVAKRAMKHKFLIFVW